MIYNTGHSFTKLIEPPTQEEIMDCAEFFALSKEEVLAHPKCTPALARIINEFPWTGRHSVVQVRPQDFRVSAPEVLGGHWHLDNMVMLNDGRKRIASSADEFKLMVISFGEVVETEFIRTPLDLPNVYKNECTLPELLFDRLGQEQFEIHSPLPNQMVEYTSKDMHRIGLNPKLGNCRLMIVAFECDSYMGGGIVLPSINEKNMIK